MYKLIDVIHSVGELMLDNEPFFLYIVSLDDFFYSSMSSGRKIND